jgi:hypothetical protein
MPDTSFLALPNPNTQPIYPRVPIDWRCNLTNQVTPYDVNVTGAAKPILLGTASPSGALIESFSTASLIPFNTSSPDGAYGLSPGGVTAELRFYTVRFGDERYWFEGPRILQNVFRIEIPDNVFPNYYPILPSPQRAWRLGPYERMYVGLSAPIAYPGLNVFMRGGQYS